MVWARQVLPKLTLPGIALTQCLLVLPPLRVPCTTQQQLQWPLHARPRVRRGVRTPPFGAATARIRWVCDPPPTHTPSHTRAHTRTHAHPHPRPPTVCHHHPGHQRQPQRRDAARRAGFPGVQPMPQDSTVRERIFLEILRAKLQFAWVLGNTLGSTCTKG